MNKLHIMENIELTTCMFCNTLLNGESQIVSTTRLSHDGPFLPEILLQHFQNEFIFPVKTDSRICNDCLKAYQDLNELKEKYENLKERLWNQYQNISSKKTSDDRQNFKKVEVEKISRQEVISEQVEVRPDLNLEQEVDNENSEDDSKKTPRKRWTQSARNKATGAFVVCKICKKWFRGKKVPRNHNHEHVLSIGSGDDDQGRYSPDNYTCKFCKAEFTNRKEKKIHENGHSELLYKCRVCEFAVVSKVEAIQHAKGHDKSVTMDFEIENAFDWVFLNESNEADGPLFLSNEPFESSDEEPLSELKKKEPKEEVKGIISPRGRKPRIQRATSVREADSAKNTENGEITFPPIRELKYKCEFCDKMWKTKGELNAHKISHSDARPFICEICGQAYKHKHALDVHVSMHKGIFEHQCTYCMKAFTQKGALQRHLPIHTGEMPYQCELCGKRFVHRTSFSIHNLAHTGIRHIKCEICNLGVLSKSHLRRHMRIHSGEKPFKCSSCGKTFAERYNLVAHQRIHDPAAPGPRVSRKKQHTCRLCFTTFPSKLKMEEHLVSHHTKMEEDQRPNIFESSDSSYIQPSKYLMEPENAPKIEISDDSKSQLSPVGVPRRVPQTFPRLEYIRTSNDANVVRLPNSIMENSQVWTY